MTAAAPERSAQANRPAGEVLLLGTPQTPPRAHSARLGRFELTLGLEPVWTITSHTVSSHVVVAQAFRRAAKGLVPVASQDLEPDVATAMDIEAIAFAESAIHDVALHKQRLSLHVPINFSSLSSGHGRRAVLQRLRSVGPAAGDLFVSELVAMPERVSRAGLVETAGVLRSNCRAVIGRYPQGWPSLEGWKDAGLAAVAFDFASAVIGKGGPEQIQEAGRLAGRVTTGLVGYGLRNRSEILAAWAAGFTHVSGRVISEGVGPLFSSTRFNPLDLYNRQSKAAGASDWT
jgi:hypothetical protein